MIPDLRDYYSIRDTMGVKSGVVSKVKSIPIPKSTRRIMLKNYIVLIAEGQEEQFLRIEINHDIKNIVKHCEHCEGRKTKNQR